MPPVRFQLGFAGAPGTDAAALAGQALAHAGESGQQILVLGQLHLKPSLPGFGPLGENIQNQGTAVQHRHPDYLLQSPDISRGKLVVKHHHGRGGGLHQHFHFYGLALTDEAVGIGGVAVLEYFPGAEAPGGFQQGLQLLQSLVGGSLLLGEAVRVQPHQHRPLLQRLIVQFFHRHLLGKSIKFILL